MDKLPPVYLIGPIFLPLMSMKHSNDRNTDDATTKWWLQWLDLEPARSMVYVRFDNRSTKLDSNITELAIGLDGRGKQFLFVLRN